MISADSLMVDAATLVCASTMTWREKVAAREAISDTRMRMATDVKPEDPRDVLGMRFMVRSGVPSPIGQLD